MRAAILHAGFFVLGAGIGFAATTALPASGERREGPHEAADRRAPRRPDPAPIRDEHRGREPSIPPGDQSPPGADRSLARALAALPLPAPCRGTERIFGTVRTRSGDPLPNVQVRAVPEPAYSPDLDDLGTPLDLEAEVREIVLRHHRETRLARSAVTDADGAFVIPDLAAGHYRVTASGVNLEIPYGDASVTLPSAESVDFIGEPLVSLGVEVLLPDGRLAEIAEITFDAGLGRVECLWTRDSPGLALKPGAYEVSAKAGERGEWRSPRQSITLREGEAPPPLRIELKQYPGICGRVVPAESEAADEVAVSVFVLLTPPGSTLDPDRLVREGRRESAERWGRLANYGFAFNDLPRGTYAVGVARARSDLVASTTVEVGDGMTAIDLALPPIVRADAIVVAAFGPQGEPLRNYGAELELARDGCSTVSGFGEVRRPDETSWLLPPRALLQAWREARPGEVDLEVVVTSTYGKKRERVPRGAEPRIDVRFQEPAVLAFSLSGYAGSGLEGMMDVGLEQPGATRKTEIARSREIDPSGHGEIGPVEPGSYDLVIRVHEGWTEAKRSPVTLASGRNEIQITIPPLFPLRALFGRRGRASLFSLPTPDTAGHEPPVDRYCETDAFGAASFPGIPPGDFELRFEATDTGKNQQMLVTVRGATEVSFVPSSYDAVLVCVKEGPGALIDAGFRSGDLIVAVDGQPLDIGRSADPGDLLSHAGTTPASTLTLLRGGATVTLEVTRELWSKNRSELGGALHATFHPR